MALAVLIDVEWVFRFQQKVAIQLTTAKAASCVWATWQCKGDIITFIHAA